jgi:hypothetical protein
MLKIAGVTLLEVMISLLLFSFVLWGLAAMQLSALHKAQAAFYFLQATMQIESMIERLSTIQQGNILTNEISAWNEENRLFLPNGYGMLKKDNSYYDISLYWGDPPYDCHSIPAGLSGCLQIKVAP